jgi:hypothetical protein
MKSGGCDNESRSRSGGRRMLKHRIFLFVLMLAAASSSPIAAAESVYTDFPFDNPRCKSLLPEAAADEPDGGGVSMVCPGYKGFDVYYKEGDSRVSVHYGHLADEVIADAWESFGAFNSVGEKIEWRLDDSGVPLAAIHRYNLANFNPETGMADEALKGEVLVISRVGGKDDKSGCFVGLVDARANKDANEIARKVADTLAAKFSCGKDMPEYHGTRGPNAGDPTISFGDAQ